jgi:hypothetical protein
LPVTLVNLNSAQSSGTQGSCQAGIALECARGIGRRPALSALVAAQQIGQNFARLPVAVKEDYVKRKSHFLHR